MLADFISRHRGRIIAALAITVTAVMIALESGGEVPVGTPTPAFSFQLLDSDVVVTRESLLGKPAVLDFWATWCTPCRETLPRLDILSRDYAGRVGFYAVTAQAEPEAMLRRFRDETHLQLPIALDGEPLASHFRITRLPTTVLLDRDGRVVWSEVGVPNEKLLRRQLDQLLR